MRYYFIILFSSIVCSCSVLVNNNLNNKNFCVDIEKLEVYDSIYKNSMGIFKPLMFSNPESLSFCLDSNKLIFKEKDSLSNSRIVVLEKIQLSERESEVIIPARNSTFSALGVHNYYSFNHILKVSKKKRIVEIYLLDENDDMAKKFQFSFN